MLRPSLASYVADLIQEATKMIDGPGLNLLGELNFSVDGYLLRVEVAAAPAARKCMCKTFTNLSRYSSREFISGVHAGKH